MVMANPDKNPWLGLKTYTEDDVVRNGYKFCGREEETLLFSQMIDYNLVNTIYGRSGVGKSSLLEAGVFQEIRKKGFTPFWIRLNINSNTPFSKQIIDFIEDYASDSQKDNSDAIERIKIKPVVNDVETIETSDPSYLWHYFHTREFFKNRSGEWLNTIPVLVFDQFEEPLLQRNQEASRLLTQLYTLIYSIYSAESFFIKDSKYRLVFSLREDYLYLLEETIDNHNLPLFKDNRFRLQALKTDQARKIILNVGSGIVDNKNADSIATKIIEYVKSDSEERIKPKWFKRIVSFLGKPSSENTSGSKAIQNNVISTQIVSLMCYQLFEKAYKRNPDKPVIDSTLVNDPKEIESSLTNFYIERRKKINNHEKAFLYKELIDKGQRKLVSYKSFIYNVPHHKYLMNENIVHKCTIPSNKEPQVEIIHDQIAKVIFKEETKHVQRRRLLLLSLLSILFGIASLLFSWHIIHERSFTQPIPFDYEEYVNKSISWMGRPYGIKDGHLVLKDCHVDSYAFPNGWDIDTLSLCGEVVLSPNSITGGNIKVLELKGTVMSNLFSQNANNGVPPFNIDSLQTIIIDNSVLINGKISPVLNIRKLKKAFIDNERFRFEDGTLLYLQNDSIWDVVLSRREKVFFDSASMKVRSSIGKVEPFSTFNLANKKNWTDNQQTNYILTSTDPAITKIKKSDIPNGNIIGINLPYIVEICDDVFSHCNLYSCQFIYINNAKSIGKSAFTTWMPSLDTVAMPDTIFLHERFANNLFGSAEHINKDSLFEGKVIFCNSDTIPFKWNRNQHFFENATQNNLVYSNNPQLPNLPTGAYGYHYVKEQFSTQPNIVFDSCEVYIPAIEYNPVLLDSIDTIPSKIVVELSQARNDYTCYCVLDNVLYYRSNSDAQWNPILALSGEKITKIDFKTDMPQKAFGSNKYSIYWPMKYSIPNGDTIFVPYGQVPLFKRIYGNGITIMELSFRESRIMQSHPFQWSANQTMTDSINGMNLTIASRDMYLDNYLQDRNYFDRPIINKVTISRHNSYFKVRGNIIYDYHGNAIRNINNDKPTVLFGFIDLGGRKIHSGTYVLLREDAIFPEPSLIPDENYIFFVRAGSAIYYNKFKDQNIQIVEMSKLKTLRYRLFEWANRIHRIHSPHNGSYIWTVRDNLLPFILYVLLAIVIIISSLFIDKSKAMHSRNLKIIIKPLPFALIEIVVAILVPIILFSITKSTASLYIDSFLIFLTIIILLNVFFRIWNKRHIPFALLILPITCCLLSCNPKVHSESELQAFPFKKGRLFGIVNSHGEIIVPPDYNFVNIQNDSLIQVQHGIYYGWYDLKGQRILPCRFINRSITTTFYDGKYYSIISDNNGKFGVITSDGDILIPFEHYGISIVKINGKPYFVTDGNTNNLIGIDNVQLNNTLSVSSPRFENNGNTLLSHRDRSGLQGLINPLGDTIIPHLYKSIVIQPIGDSIFLKVIDSSGHQGIIDFQNKSIIPPLYKKINIYGNGTGTYCLLADDDNNRFVLPVSSKSKNPDFSLKPWPLSELITSDFSIKINDTTCFYIYDNGKQGLVNIFDRIMIPCKYDMIANLSYNIPFFKALDNGRRIIIDSHGNELFDYGSDSLFEAVCSTPDNPFFIMIRDSLYGVFDKYHNEIIPFKYSSISSGFSQWTTYFTVFDGQKEGIVDINGKTIVPLQQKKRITNHGNLFFLSDTVNDGIHKKFKFDVHTISGKKIKNCESYSWSWNSFMKKRHEIFLKRKTFGRIRFYLVKPDGSVIRNCRNVQEWKVKGKSIIVYQKGNRVYIIE